MEEELICESGEAFVEGLEENETSDLCEEQEGGASEQPEQPPVMPPAAESGGRLRRLGPLEELRKQEDAREFLAVFPQAARNPETIPPEVWAEVRQGRTLVGAYARYAGSMAQQKMEALQRTREMNRAGAARSTGSLRSAEGGFQRKDAFLQGFQDE